jgi:magnesium chelatase subunit D
VHRAVLPAGPEADSKASAQARTAPSPWADAVAAATLMAIDPVGLGGVNLRALAGPVRDHWLALLAGLLPEGTPLRRVPLHINDERLLGGLDLAATLRAGRPAAQRGVLAEADGGVLLMAMAERLPAATAARLVAVLDAGEVLVARDGVSLHHPARLGVVALDEGATPDECAPPGLMDRLAFHLDLADVPWREVADAGFVADARAVLDARAGLARVRIDDDLLQALCGAALALGTGSLRASVLALRAACAAAALDGREAVSADDAALAARLVLGPRATRLPLGEAVPPEPEADALDEAEPPEPSPPDEGSADTDANAADADTSDNDSDQTERDTPDPTTHEPLDDVVLAAAKAAIPAGLLALLQGQAHAARGGGAGGRAGQLQASRRRGRPAGARRGEPRNGARLNVIETLRAAAPWQRLRRGELTAAGQGDLARTGTHDGIGTIPSTNPSTGRIQVRAEDFHITRFKQRSETTTIFAIDASGSAALHRLAEAKGAVELLLADCYVRRDRVAVLAFRGKVAEVLLPPTRSLVRAKRSLAGLPGGGGTPLAAGIDAAAQLADAMRRRGDTPVIVFLTDGRANIARDGTPGRALADAQAMDAARQLRAARFTALLVDTSAQPQPGAQRLALEMGARYLPLPNADANALSRSVRVLAAGAAGPG